LGRQGYRSGFPIPTSSSCKTSLSLPSQAICKHSALSLLFCQDLFFLDALAALMAVAFFLTGNTALAVVPIELSISRPGL
jgi:hypothetical protein